MSEVPVRGNVRSVSEVLQDIVGNIQEIVTSEVRLAKLEIKQDAIKAKPAGVLLTVGVLVGLFSAQFLLLAIFFGLSTQMPHWEAAIIVGLFLAITALGTLSAGRKALKQIPPRLERTTISMKENLEWIAQRTK